MGNKSLSAAHRGIALVWALIAVAVVTTIVGALGSYYTQVGRLARFYQNQTGEKFAAWRGLDEMYHKYFANANNSQDAATVAKAFFSGSKKSYTDSQSTKYSTTSKVYQGSQAMTEAKLAEALEKMNKGDKLELEILVTSTKTTANGLPSVSKLLEVVEIQKGSQSAGGLETMRAFNYVYFANNYGRLDESVVANGDIGGNDRFTLNGARVNGYVDVRGTSDSDKSAVVLQNSPKMWPYYYYMKRVVENDESDLAVSTPGYDTSSIDYYTPSRPTDPIYISETSNIVWKGGYEPPGINSQYGDIDSSGQFVSLPVNPHTEEVAKYVGTNPYTDDYLNYYNNDNSKKTNPKQTEYLQYFNADGSPATHENQAEYFTYYSAIGVAVENPNKATYLEYWNADNTAKPYEKQGDLDQLEAGLYEYFNSISDYNSAKFKSNPYKKNPEKRNWTNGKSAWNKKGENWALSDGDNRINYNKLSSEKATYTTAQNNAKTKYDTWNNNKASFDSSPRKTAYETWVAARTAWIASDDGKQQYDDWNASQDAIKVTYDKWNSDKATASANFTNWQRTFEDWLNNLKSGGNEIDLTWETAHLSVSNKVQESKRIINVTTNVVEVPNMSDGSKMQEIIDYCRSYSNRTTAAGSSGGWLHCANRFKMDSGAEIDISITNRYKYHREYYRTGILATENYRNIEPIEHTGLTRTLAEITVAGGDGSSVNPFKNEDSAFAEVSSLMQGSVILIGTEDYPIEIDGPVYFPGDVVIRGFVKGKGTIYAGRNVHIIGDITYLNPPSWPHKNMNAPQNHPEVVAKRNQNSDVLMLVSRGNIVVGDYTSDIWQSNANMKYLKSYGETSPACNDFNEPGIGYNPGFGRDYTQSDGGKMVSAENVKTTSSGTDLIWVYNRWGDRVWGLYAWTEDKYNLEVKQVSRKYYESIFGSSVISGFKQVATSDPFEGWKMSSSLRQRILSIFFGRRVTSEDVSKSKSPAAGDITEINAALISNHGIFGVVGGEGIPQFTLNGAMICRDEGLLPSFTSRFSGYTKRKIWLNWDLRLRSSSAEGVLYGAIMKYVENTTVPEYVIRIKSTSQVR